MGQQAIYDSVRELYGQVARQENSQRGRERYATIAAAFGYAADDLAALPDGANLGVSCGNPLAVAGLKEVRVRVRVRVCHVHSDGEGRAAGCE